MQERVQLNLSVTPEQKLALRALAEGHGVSVTALVLSLIGVGALAPRPAVFEVVADAGDGAPAIVERPASSSTKPCRHGLVSCRTCGTGRYA